MNTFTDLGLADGILEALATAGYETPTPIQLQAIPPVLAGSDLLGIAQTGTGKTAAFALPILHRLGTIQKRAARKGCRVLVLSPTRELAAQIADSFKTYAANMRISVATVFGGVGHRAQIKALSHGVDILVATPGRLIDHLTTGTIKLDQVEAVVLDEADQMLDLGFVRPIRTIVSRLPKDRQTLFFSATMPPSIAALAKEFLKDPVRVSVAPVASTAERVNQRVLHVEAGAKRAALAKLIIDENMYRVIVFTRTKHGADRVAKSLETAGMSVAAIHGNKSQNQRERALEAFKQAKIQVLVATDIAARGIDVDDVSHVINFELPEVPEAYVHRIGRTARAGASGNAISLCDHSELKYLRGIERLIRQKIPSEGDAWHPAGRADESTRTDASGADQRPPKKKRRPQRAPNAGDAKARSRGAAKTPGRTDAKPAGQNRGKPRPSGAKRNHRKGPARAAAV